MNELVCLRIPDFGIATEPGLDLVLAVAVTWLSEKYLIWVVIIIHSSF